MPIIKGTNHHDYALIGGAGNDQIYGLNGDDWLIGGAGHDWLDGGNGTDRMWGGIGDDIYIVDRGNDEVIEFEGEGHDTVRASVHYTMTANVEDLILTGSSNINGWGNSLDNHIYGNAGRNSLWGGDGRDELHGGAGNDFLDGGDQDDTMFGGTGADFMVGGEGNDTYYVDQLGDSITENSEQGWDWVHSTISYVLGYSVDGLILDGTANIDGAGNELHNALYGNSGNNMLFGYGGDDYIVGGRGNDSMFGGEGDDSYDVEDEGDKVFETFGRGMDSVTVYGDFDYTLTANVENLKLYGHGSGTGNELENYIAGNDYDNVLDGRGGIDHMIGGYGDDTYYVDATGDEAREVGEFEGHDTVFSTADYTLGEYVDVLSLANGNAVYGAGNDQDNTIFGNAGSNILSGRGGADTLSGLGGNDTFIFFAGEANGDSIYEFEGNGAGGGDLLEFHGYGTAAQGATLVFVGGDSWQINSADGTVHETIHLAGAPTLDPSDYVFL